MSSSGLFPADLIAITDAPPKVTNQQALANEITRLLKIRPQGIVVFPKDYGISHHNFEQIETELRSRGFSVTTGRKPAMEVLDNKIIWIGHDSDLYTVWITPKAI